MRFSITVPCSCGYEFPVAGYGDERFPVSVCPKCNAAVNIFDPLSISVVAERMLHRSKGEMESGDYTLSILLSAMAVECFLTQAFLKWEGIGSLKSTGHLPTESEKVDLEKGYTKRAGFLTPADFVSNYLVGLGFDEFVSMDAKAGAIMAGFSDSAGVSPKEYFQQSFFKRRNRIVHWGKVDYEKMDAEFCLRAAIAIVGILKLMDNQKYEKMERDWRQANQLLLLLSAYFFSGLRAK
jgi:hypothetical protein